MLERSQSGKRQQRKGICLLRLPVHECRAIAGIVLSFVQLLMLAFFTILFLSIQSTK